ncbi:helix-turn-helix transcriptional regulator [Frondihabitans cladoniiphilus]|uniref:Helix-turn-helix transcriptional regulator n=1 Tax=Frondihabitans cladoniiphilus TaxID=715785 RepID=A0ABP8W9X8_9MICO
MTSNLIGDYLRARREQVRPEDVGLVDNGRRRVRGLRRDELAMLAGISTEYYTRLEQGRDQHPSTQVLDAVSRALNLDEDGRTHLYLLASPKPGKSRVVRRAERVRPSVQQLLDSWTDTAAYVHDPLLNVVASNALARALSPMFDPGENVLKSTFLDSAVHELLPDWETKVVTLVAALRAMVGPDVEDVRLTELVGELSVKSPVFARLWSRHDVRPQSGDGQHIMQHESVGELKLTYDKFQVGGTEGQTLVIYHADPGSGTSQALRLLSTLAADAEAPADPTRSPARAEEQPN